jgi:hypothetical protein
MGRQYPNIARLFIQRTNQAVSTAGSEENGTKIRAEQSEYLLAMTGGRAGSPSRRL